jgi:transcription elongation GreA/GreB family factor
VSKAFTKESDDVPEAPVRRRGIPVPAPNYVTADGLRAARAELEELSRTAGDPDRAHELTEHLATAEVVEPTDRAIAGLGATVTVEDEAGHRTSYRIVGAIEADPKRGWLSWQTPIANALFGARIGDTVELPRGEAEIVAIEYGQY